MIVPIPGCSPPTNGAKIARAYFVPEATMAQRISRAKQTVRRAGARFEPPPAAQRAERLTAGLAVVAELEADERMARHHRLHAVRAHLLETASLADAFTK